MAGTQSILAALPVLQQGINLAQSIQAPAQGRAEQSQALEQLKSRQAEDQRQAQESAAQQREAIAVAARQKEEERKNALRRAVARQRSRFGSQGLGTGNGSSEAVLLGLFEESEDERRRREELDALRLGALDQDLSQRNSLNVLQRTQLAERQRLDDITSQNSRISRILGSVSSVGKATGNIF